MGKSILSWERRLQAVEMYEALGCHVFPYHWTGGPWARWPEKGLPWEYRATALQPDTDVFGVALSGDVVCIDVDADRGGVIPEGLPPTLTVVSPSGAGNRHLFFKVRGEPLRKGGDLFGPGVDLLGLGQHVKGATSWRADRQHRYFVAKPVLPVAYLPEAIEEQWRQSQGNSSEVVPTPIQAPVMEPAEGWESLVHGWIDQGLSAISAAVEGQRRMTVCQHATNIIRCADLLGIDVDEHIAQAYEDSGGDDPGWLSYVLETGHEYAEAYPKSAPATNNPDEKAGELASDWLGRVLEWADPRKVVLPKLATAMAAEATWEEGAAVLSVPVDTVRKLHKLGNGGSPRQRVYDAVAELVEAGFLSVESVRYTSNGHEWKAYQLR